MDDVWKKVNFINQSKMSNLKDVASLGLSF